jgi:hypothetical protein
MQPVGLGPRARRRHRGGRPVRPDHYARRPHQVGRDRGDLPVAAPDIEHAHSCPDPGLAKDLQGERPDDLRLMVKTRELPLGMPELIVDRTADPIAGAHRNSPSAQTRGRAIPSSLPCAARR